MESSKALSILFACLLVNCVLAQPPPTYRAESSQKVQLDDIEQDNLKSVSQSTNQVQSSPQYTSQYSGQNPQLVYSVPAQQSQHVAPVQAGPPQTNSYPLFAVPTQAGAGLPGQQHYIYYMQPQQLAYDFPVFGNGYPFVPQTAQSVLPQNVNVNELYKSLQPQTQSASGKSVANVKTAAAAPQLPNYYFSSLAQPYYSPAVHIPQVPVSNSPQYVTGYNSFYPVQTAQKSVYSAGVKSTTAAPVKQQQTESSYRFEYNSPEFSKLRVSG